MKHYRIRRLDEGGFFLTRRRTFSTLNEFVSHYTKTSDGLCVKLGKPCLKVKCFQAVFLTFEITFLLQILEFFVIYASSEKKKKVIEYLRHG